MRSLLVGIGILVLTGGGATAVAQGTVPFTELDSVVLERTTCYGTCPAYRLALLRSGVVQFRSHNRGDSSRVARDSIKPDLVAALLPTAVRLKVFDLPPVIAESPTLCPDRATDHPTVIVTLYGAGEMRRIVDYHGCFHRSDHSTPSGLSGLRAFEARVDSVAGAKRWVQPNRFR
jgi:hypothetical protein